MLKWVQVCLKDLTLRKKKTRREKSSSRYGREVVRHVGKDGSTRDRHYRESFVNIY